MLRTAERFGVQEPLAEQASLPCIKSSLSGYGLPDLQPAFLHSLELMKQQNVQLVLGNHPGPNHILQKMEKLLNNPQGGNPFIDPTGQDWQNYLAWVEAEFKQFMADGR